MHDHDSIGEDPVEHGASRSQGSGALVHGLGGGIALLAYAWWVASLRPFSGAATTAVLVTGAGAAVAGARRLSAERPDAWGPAMAAWGVLAACAGAWQLAAYLQHPRSEHPTLSSLANELLNSHPLRAVLFAVWALGAMWLARR